MLISTILLSHTYRTLTIAALALGAVGLACAEGYTFNKQVPGGGGGGGPDPEKKRIVSSMGGYICLDVSPSTNNQVRFTLWSETPQPNARIARIHFDTGSHRDLFSGLSVVFQSLGVKSTVINPKRDVSSSNARMTYLVQFPYEYPQGGNKTGFKVVGGVAPGNTVVISATLGLGQTFAGVVGALNEGFNPITEMSGLRIWVSGHYFLGGPPPGRGTIMDDATFMLSGPSPRCQRR